MRFAFVHAEKVNHRVSTLCRVLNVSRSGYYAWARRGPSARTREDERLRVLLRALHRASGGTYGAPRLHRDLVEDGEQVSRKRVARLMTEEGIRGAYSPPKVRTTWPAKSVAVEDRVRGEFSAPAPNRVWTADTTYIRCGKNFVFLVVLLDLFSRRIVGWELGRKLDGGLARRALWRAFALRRPDAGLVVHSDHGVEFVNERFAAMLEARGALQSLGRVGSCFDNAASESLFGTLKVEIGLTRGRGFANYDEAHRALGQYIDEFYNSQRRHSTIGYASPVDYEFAWRCGRVAA